MQILGGDLDKEVFDGREIALEETLNPQFYQTSEIYPVILNEDWKFQISVWDVGDFSDTLVGSTIIDLEQRRWSKRSVLAKLILMQEVDITTE